MTKISPPQLIGDQFFRVKESKREYFGNRWFRYNSDDDKVIQICIMPGDMVVKSGKHSSIGIYVMGKLSFMSNYYAMGYVDVISKEEYESAFNKIFTILR